MLSVQDCTSICTHMYMRYISHATGKKRPAIAASRF